MLSTTAAQQQHQQAAAAVSHIVKYKIPRRVDRQAKERQSELARTGPTRSAVHWLLVCSKYMKKTNLYDYYCIRLEW